MKGRRTGRVPDQDASGGVDVARAVEPVASIRWATPSRPPLHGFQLPALPAARLDEVTTHLERTARTLRRNRTSPLIRKLLDRAAELRRQGKVAP